MASIRYSDYIEQLDPKYLEEPADLEPMPDGSYRVQALSAARRYARSGYEMFVVSLVVTDGRYKGHKIPWYLTIVPEMPDLLNKFFRNMGTLGVAHLDFATATSPHDIIRKIVNTAATLDIELKTNAKDFRDVTNARRVPEQEVGHPDA